MKYCNTLVLSRDPIQYASANPNTTKQQTKKPKNNKNVEPVNLNKRKQTDIYIYILSNSPEASNRIFTI